MSKKLYYSPPGHTGKPLKLPFTIDDIPILEEWYKTWATSGMPEFKDVDFNLKCFMANTVSFSNFRLRYLWKEVMELVKLYLKSTIKNFFRWKKNTKTN